MYTYKLLILADKLSYSVNNMLYLFISSTNASYTFTKFQLTKQLGLLPSPVFYWPLIPEFRKHEKKKNVTQLK